MERLRKTLCLAILAGVFGGFSGVAHAATVNITRNEVSVGFEYVIGFGPTMNSDSQAVVSDGLDPVLLTMGGEIMGDYLSFGYHEISILQDASASLAFDDHGVVAPSLSGTSAASISYGEHSGALASSAASAPATDNYIFYEFEVVGEEADFSVSYRNDQVGTLNLVADTGLPVVILSDGQSFISTLDPGVYTLTTMLSFSANAGTSQSGSSTFTMTFPGSNLNYIPEPASLTWLAGLALCVGRRRRG